MVELWQMAIPPIWCAVADRVRGGFPDDNMFGKQLVIWPGLSTGEFKSTKPAYVDHVRHAIKFTYGMALVLPFTTVWWQVLVAGVTWKFGEQIAGDFGGTFRYIAGENKWFNPLIRVGLMWPLATIAALAYWCLPLVMLFGISVLACGLSALAAKEIWYTPKMPSWMLQLQTPGAWQEVLRGFINGSLAVVVGANL